MWVQPLGQEGPLEEAMAAHSSILAWRIPWAEEPGGLQSMGSQSQTRLKQLSTHTIHVPGIHWFLSLSGIPLYGCHSLFIHSTADEHLGCFWVLTFTNKTSMDISIQIFLWIYASFFLDKYLRVEQMGLRVGVFRIQEECSKPNNKQKVNQSKSRQRFVNIDFSREDIQMANNHMKRYLTLLVIPPRSVQSLSCVWRFATSWTEACRASLSITSSQSSPKLMSVESVMPSNHLILCRPLLLLPSLFPSIRDFSNESAFQEMQVKTIVSDHCTLIRMARVKETDHSQWQCHVGELSLHTLLAEMENGTDTLKNYLVVSGKVECKLTI